MEVLNFVEHDERGFSVPESIPLEQYQDRFPLPLKIESVSWEDSVGLSHSIHAKKLSVRVLPDRSGLICIESPTVEGGRYVGQHGAFILNVDASIRHRLSVPIELIPRIESMPSDSALFFLWVEPSEGEGQCRLVGVVTGVGEFRFDLNYVSGKFLATYEAQI